MLGLLHPQHPVPASTFHKPVWSPTPPQFFHRYPEPVVLCPLFAVPPQSCSLVTRSCGWPWAPFPAFSRGGMVVCRACLCLRSFLGLAGNLMVFNLLEHMFRQWLGVKEWLGMDKKSGYVCCVFLVILKTTNLEHRSVVSLALCSSASFSLHLLCFGAAVG